MTDVLFDTKGRKYGRSIADRIDATGDCWTWTGYVNPAGYGCVGFNSATRLVHRVVWEALVGQIPDRLELDHLCRNPPCCNPDHLEVVTHAENMRRGIPRLLNMNKTHCAKAGHPLTGANLYVNAASGSRQCRACQSESMDRFLERRRNEQ